MPESNTTIYNVYLYSIISDPEDKRELNCLLRDILVPDYKQEIEKLIKAIHSFDTENTSTARLIMQLIAKTDPTKFNSVRIQKTIPGFSSNQSASHIFSYLIKTLGTEFRIPYQATSLGNNSFRLNDLFDIRYLKPALQLVFIVTLVLLIGSAMGSVNSFQASRERFRTSSNEDDDSLSALPENSAESYLPPDVLQKIEYTNELTENVITQQDSDFTHNIADEIDHDADYKQENYISRHYKRLLYQGDKKFKLLLRFILQKDSIEALNVFNSAEWYLELMKLGYSDSLDFLLKTLKVDVLSIRSYFSSRVRTFAKQSFTPDDLLKPGIIEATRGPDNTLIAKVSSLRDIQTITIQNFIPEFYEEETKLKIMRLLVEHEIVDENSSFFPSVFYYSLVHSSLDVVKCIQEYSGIINITPDYSDMHDENMRPNYIESNLIWTALLEQTRPEVIEYIFMQNPSLDLENQYNAELFYKSALQKWSADIKERAIIAFINYLDNNNIIIFNPHVIAGKNTCDQTSLLSLASSNNDEVLLKFLFTNKKIISRLETTPLWLKELNKATINFANNENAEALSIIFDFYNVYYITRKIINIFDRRLTVYATALLVRKTGYALLEILGKAFFPLFFAFALNKLIQMYKNSNEKSLEKIRDQLSEILKPYNAICQRDGDEFKIIFQGQEKALLPVSFDKSVKRIKQKAIEVDLSEAIDSIKEQFKGVFEFKSSPPTLTIKKSKYSAQLVNQLQESLQELIAQSVQREIVSNRLLSIIKKTNTDAEIQVTENSIKYTLGSVDNNHIVLRNELVDLSKFISEFSPFYESVKNKSIEINGEGLIFSFSHEIFDDVFLEKFKEHFNIVINTLINEKKQEIENTKRLAEEGKARELAEAKRVKMSQDLSNTLKKFTKDITLKKVDGVVEIAFSKKSISIYGVDVDSDAFIAELNKNLKSINVVSTDQSDNYNAFSFPYADLNQHLLNSLEKAWSTTADGAVKKYHEDQSLKLKIAHKKLLPILSNMLSEFNNNVDCKEENGNIIIILDKKFKKVTSGKFADFGKKLNSKLVELGLRGALKINNNSLMIQFSGELFDKGFIHKLRVAISSSIAELEELIENTNKELMQRKEQKRLENQQRLLNERADKKRELITELEKHFGVEEKGNNIFLRFSQQNYPGLSSESKTALHVFLKGKFKSVSFSLNEKNIEIKFLSKLLNEDLIKMLRSLLVSCKEKTASLHVEQLNDKSMNTNSNLKQLPPQKIVTKSNAKNTIVNYFSPRIESIREEIDALELLITIDYLNADILNATYFKSSEIIMLSKIDRDNLSKIHTNAIFYHLSMFFDKLPIDRNERDKINKEDRQFFDEMQDIRNKLVHFPNIDASVLTNLLRELRGDYYELSVGKIGPISSAEHKIELEFTEKPSTPGIRARVYHADANSIDDLFFDHETNVYLDAYRLYRMNQSVSENLQYLLKEKVLATTQKGCRKKGLITKMKEILFSLETGDISNEIISSDSILSAIMTHEELNKMISNENSLYAFQSLPSSITLRDIPSILKKLQEAFNLIIYTYRQEPDENSIQFQPWLAAINMLMTTIRNGLRPLMQSKDAAIQSYYFELTNCIKNNNNFEKGNALIQLCKVTNEYIAHAGNVEAIEDSHKKGSIKKTLSILKKITLFITEINQVCVKGINENKSPLLPNPMPTPYSSYQPSVHQQMQPSSRSNNNLFLPLPQLPHHRMPPSARSEKDYLFPPPPPSPQRVIPQVLPSFGNTNNRIFGQSPVVPVSKQQPKSPEVKKSNLLPPPM